MNKANIRDKPIMHITVGDDNWHPSEVELEELKYLFMAADLKNKPVNDIISGD